jgi:hypothetical protein
MNDNVRLDVYARLTAAFLLPEVAQTIGNYIKGFCSFSST